MFRDVTGDDIAAGVAKIYAGASDQDFRASHAYFGEKFSTVTTELRNTVAVAPGSLDNPIGALADFTITTPVLHTFSLHYCKLRRYVEH